MKFGQHDERLIGVMSAAGAYILWGILPLYWKLIEQVPAFEILAHRIIWSFLFTVGIIFATGKLKPFWGELIDNIFHLRNLSGIFLASFLITVNWGTYIWAVNNNHIVESSLGYYINPLVSVLLGIIVFKEKLSFWQLFSFFLAVLGVLNMTVHFGAIPWVSLLLAVTFGLYGLCKKMIRLGAITGITLETLFIAPFALIYLNHVHNSGAGAFSFGDPGTAGLLAGAGIVTAVPLVLFAGGAKRLPLTIVGFLQYISPTISLSLGVFLFHEQFTGVHLASFMLIWAALTIFSLSGTRSFSQLEAALFKKISVKGLSGK
jgi:chloramphenicol-sensitive protein RarD